IQPLLTRVAERSLHLWADVEGAPVVIGGNQVHDRRHVLHERPVLLLGPPDGLFRLLLRRDVVHHALPGSDLAGWASNGHGPVANPEPPSVPVPDPVLALERLPVRSGHRPGLCYQGAILGVGVVAPELRPSQVGGWRIAEDP